MFIFAVHKRRFSSRRIAAVEHSSCRVRCFTQDSLFVMKRLLLLFLFAVAVLGASAQQGATANVYLRDGQIVKAREVERLQGGIIRVQTVEGNTFTFLSDEVLNVVEVRRLSPFADTPVWRGYAEVGYTTPNQYDVQLTGGLSLNNAFFLGVGVGYVAQPDAAANAMPIFAVGRFYLPLQVGVRPYVDARLGYAIPMNDTDVSGGTFVGLTVGVEVKRWMLGVGYQGVNMNYGTIAVGAVPTEVATGGFTLRLGFRF